MYYSYLEDVYDSYFEDMNNNKLYHKLPNNCKKNVNNNTINNNTINNNTINKNIVNKNVNNKKNKKNVNNKKNKTNVNNNKKNKKNVNNNKKNKTNINGGVTDVEAKQNQDAINNQNDAIQNKASNTIKILDGAGLKKNLLENENNCILLGLLLLFFVDCYYKF